MGKAFEQGVYQSVDFDEVTAGDLVDAFEPVGGLGHFIRILDHVIPQRMVVLLAKRSAGSPIVVMVRARHDVFLCKPALLGRFQIFVF